MALSGARPGGWSVGLGWGTARGLVPAPPRRPKPSWDAVEGGGCLPRGSCFVWPSVGSGFGRLAAAQVPSACTQVAFSFLSSSPGSSFRFSTASFVCCQENTGHWVSHANPSGGGTLVVAWASALCVPLVPSKHTWNLRSCDPPTLPEASCQVQSPFLDLRWEPVSVGGNV